MKVLILMFAMLCSQSLFSQTIVSLDVINMTLNKACEKKQLTYDDMMVFLQSYSDDFLTNVELGEYRNEALFCIIDSKNLELFLLTLQKKCNYISHVLSDLKNPIDDTIDMDSCLRRIEKIKEKTSLSKKILTILEQNKKDALP